MAWGYEASFTIEHVGTSKKLSCRDCVYYDSSDKSCMKKGYYLPEDGYYSWRHCDFVEIDSGTSYFDEKMKQLSSNIVHREERKDIRGAKDLYNASKNNSKPTKDSVKPAILKLQNGTKISSHKKAKLKDNNTDTIPDSKLQEYCLIIASNSDVIKLQFPLRKKTTKYIPIYEDNGKKKYVSVWVDENSKQIWVNQSVYKGLIDELKRLFKGRIEYKI